MRDESDVDTLTLCQKPRHVLPTKTVPNGRDLLYAQLSPHIGNRIRDN